MGGTPPIPQLVLQTGMNEFEKNWRLWRAAAVRTEKIEELLLAWMKQGLEHSGFSQLFRFLGLKQNSQYVFSCRPKAPSGALISSFNDNMP